jgi:uncharacterized protein with HEPN domain
MQRDPKMYLADMLKAVVELQKFVNGRSLDEFQTDSLLKSAVQWQLAIIGEALSQLKKFDEAIADRITDAWKIIGFRNQIVRGYHSINDEITWKVIQNHVPVLKRELEELLA